MALKKNDFIEIEFTGRIAGEDEVFDTNIEADAKKAGLKADCKPFALSIGNKMLPIGFDNDLEGKEVGKEYSIELKPEMAFGKRDPKMVQMIPTRLFHEQNINPQRGMQLSLGGQLVRILSTSGGRVLVDFNNPLSGKTVEYKYKILKQIDDDKDKVNAIQDFLFRKRFDFEIENKKIIFKVEEKLEPMMKTFAPKFKELLDLDVETKVVEKKSSD